MMTIQNQPGEKASEQTGCLKSIVRIFWLLLGYLLLGFLALAMFLQKPNPVYDIAYAAVVVALIGVRYLDIKYLKGETEENEPATMKHWHRYSIRILLGSALGYAIAKALSSTLHFY